MHWGLVEGRFESQGCDKPLQLPARRFVNRVHAIAAEGLDVDGVAALDRWLAGEAPPVPSTPRTSRSGSPAATTAASDATGLTPEELQERLRPTWGMTPDAVAGQDAMAAMLGGLR